MDSVGVGGKGCSRAEYQDSEITKKSQLWVFPACPKILGCVAGNSWAERGSERGTATVRLEGSNSSHSTTGSWPWPAKRQRTLNMRSNIAPRTLRFQTQGVQCDEVPREPLIPCEYRFHITL